MCKTQPCSRTVRSGGRICASTRNDERKPPPYVENVPGTALRGCVDARAPLPTTWEPGRRQAVHPGSCVGGQPTTILSPRDAVGAPVCDGADAGVQCLEARPSATATRAPAPCNGTLLRRVGNEAAPVRRRDCLWLACDGGQTSSVEDLATCRLATGRSAREDCTQGRAHHQEHGSSCSQTAARSSPGLCRCTSNSTALYRRRARGRSATSAAHCQSWVLRAPASAASATTAARVTAASAPPARHRRRRDVELVR